MLTFSSFDMEETPFSLSTEMCCRTFCCLKRIISYNREYGLGIGTYIQLLFFGRFAHGWEQDHIPNGFLIGQQHGQAVDTNTEATCWWHTDLHSFQKVFIQHLSFFVTLGTLTHLIL